MRECKHFHAPGVLHEPCKDCLIEQQAERIVDLELAIETYKRGYRQVVAERNASHVRIKELEAENSGLAIDNEITGSLIEKLRDTNDARGKALAAQCTETKKLRAELAALRQRIDDAPVMAYVMICKEAEDSPQLDWDTEGWSGSWAKVPLISKEDLK